MSIDRIVVIESSDLFIYLPQTNKSIDEFHNLFAHSADCEVIIGCSPVVESRNPSIRWPWTMSTF